MKKFLLLVLIILNTNSYAANKLKFFKPAHEVLWGIKKIAVADFIIEGGNLTPLLNSELTNTKYFDVIDVNQKLSETDYVQNDLTDITKSAKICSLLQVDGVLFGKFTQYEVKADSHFALNVTKNVWTGEYERDQYDKIIEEEIDGILTKKKKFIDKVIEQPFVLRSGVVGIEFNLVDGISNKIAFKQTIIKKYNSGNIELEQQKSLPSKEKILADLSREVVYEFVKKISPKIVKTKRKIEKGEGFIDQGRKFAINGQWAEAMETWLKAAAETPNNSAIYYNLGLAYESQGEYLQAETYYKKAALLKDEKRYHKAIENLRKARQKKIKKLNKGSK